jgi:hypothetical protein
MIYKDEVGDPNAVHFDTKFQKGFVIWCPYAHEPTFLLFKDGKPHCDMCADNYEEMTHPFICRVSKPANA